MGHGSVRNRSSTPPNIEDIKQRLVRGGHHARPLNFRLYRLSVCDHKPVEIKANRKQCNLRISTQALLYLKTFGQPFQRLQIVEEMRGATIDRNFVPTRRRIDDPARGEVEP